MPEHDAQLGTSFAQHWTESDTFVTAMTQLVTHTAFDGHTRVLDVGCGTALDAHRLAQHTRHPIVCADPSAAMLAGIPPSPQFLPIQASADDLARDVHRAWPAPCRHMPCPSS